MLIPKKKAHTYQAFFSSFSLYSFSGNVTCNWLSMLRNARRVSFSGVLLSSAILFFQSVSGANVPIVAPLPGYVTSNNNYNDNSISSSIPQVGSLPELPFIKGAPAPASFLTTSDLFGAATGSVVPYELPAAYVPPLPPVPVTSAKEQPVPIAAPAPIRPLTPPALPGIVKTPERPIAQPPAAILAAPPVSGAKQPVPPAVPELAPAPKRAEPQKPQEPKEPALTPAQTKAKAEAEYADVVPAELTMEIPQLEITDLPEELALDTEELGPDLQDTDEEISLPNYAYMGEYLKPWNFKGGDELIEINFQNAELLSFIDYIQQKFGIQFILDSALQPPPAGGKSPVGIKFTFKTHRPVNKRQAWGIFVTLLSMAELAVVPGPEAGVYQITTDNPNSKLSANKAALPLFIGIDPALLPRSDLKIRYVYFIQNAAPTTIQAVVDKMRSPTAGTPILIEDLGALILTDKASIIHSILEVIKELDTAILPETLTVLRLQKADAQKVKTLYDNLVNEEKTLLQRLSPGGRKQSNIAYFTENVRMVADARTNSLFILGPRKNVRRIEDFIRKEVDREIDLPYSPLHVYRLKFIDSDATATILNEIKNFQSESGVAQVGGLIGGTKYLKPTVTITSERATNSLIINADYEDYLQIYELLQKIDIEQPQVAVRVLVLDVNLTGVRSFGTQLRNRVPTLNGVLGDNVNFQNSGLFFNGAPQAGIVQNFGTEQNPATGAVRLLGDLVALAGGNIPGSTVVTLGNDAFGVWGIFKALQTFQNVSVVSKPFLVTTNKYQAVIKVQEIRVVQQSVIVGNGQSTQPTFGNYEAGLTLQITPQISPDGLITLDVYVESSQFSNPNPAPLPTDPTQTTDQANISAGNNLSKTITTSVTVADNQILALGGLVREIWNDSESKVPILGDIPLVGWLFKNRRKEKGKASLLILISAEIMQPAAKHRIEYFTKQQLEKAEELLCSMDADEQLLDPIGRWFFNDTRNSVDLNCDAKRYMRPHDDLRKALPLASPEVNARLGGDISLDTIPNTQEPLKAESYENNNELLGIKSATMDTVNNVSTKNDAEVIEQKKEERATWKRAKRRGWGRKNKSSVPEEVAGAKAVSDSKCSGFTLDLGSDYGEEFFDESSTTLSAQIGTLPQSSEIPEQPTTPKFLVSPDDTVNYPVKNSGYRKTRQLDSFIPNRNGELSAPRSNVRGVR